MTQLQPPRCQILIMLWSKSSQSVLRTSTTICSLSCPHFNLMRTSCRGRNRSVGLCGTTSSTNSFKIVWYPSRQLYRVAAEWLVSKYPHLKDRLGSGSGLDSWVQALRNMYKNMRKKIESCSNLMAEIKQVPAHDAERV